jgi:hypothetical protein
VDVDRGQTELLGQPRPVRGDGVGVVADVAAEVERVVRRAAHAAVPVGERPADARRHVT